MNMNIELHQLEQYKDLECMYCKRKYPETILNIEGHIHHHQKGYRCIDQKKCTKITQKIRKKEPQHE